MTKKIAGWIAFSCVFGFLLSGITVGAAPRMVLQLGLRSNSAFVIMSPNGAYIAGAGSEDREVVLWQASTGAVLAHFQAQGIIYTVVFSPDSRTLAIGNDRNNVTIWNTNTGAQVRTLRVPGTRGQVENLQFDRTGKDLLASVADGPVCLLSTETGKCLFHWYASIKGRKARTRTAELSSDGRRILTATVQDDVSIAELNKSHSDAVAAALQMHDAKTGAILWQRNLGKHDLDISAQFVPGETKIFLLTDMSVDLYRASDGKPIRHWQLQTMLHASLSPDGRTAVITGIGVGGLYSMPDGHLIRPLPDTSNVWGAYYSPDGKQILATSDLTDDVQILSSRSLSLIRTLPGFSRPIVDSIAASPDGQLYAMLVAYHTSDAQSKFLLLFDAATGMLRHQISMPSISNEVVSLAFSPNSQTLACQSDGKLMLVDANSGAQLFNIHAEAFSLPPVRFSGDGKYLLTSDSEGSISFRSSVTGSVIKTLVIGQHIEVPAYALSPNGETLAVNTVRGDLKHLSGDVELWDVTRKTLTKTIVVARNVKLFPQLLFNPILFSPDGRTLVIGNLGFTDNKTALQARQGFLPDPWLELYAMPTGTRRGKIPDYGEQIAFSRDGSLLFTTHLAAWDVKSGRVVWKTTQQITGNDELAFASKDGLKGRIITSSLLNDGGMTIWDARTGKEKAKIVLLPLMKDAQGQLVQWITITPQGYYRASPDATRWLSWRKGALLLPAAALAEQRNKPEVVQQTLNR